MRSVFLALALAAPLRGADLALRLPQASPAQLAALAGAAKAGAPLDGLNLSGSFAALSAGPLAQELRDPGLLTDLANLGALPADRREKALRGLAAAKERAAASATELASAFAEAVGRGDGSPQQLAALSTTITRWDWYGERAAAAVALLRAELRRRRAGPLLRDPFERRDPEGESAAPTPASLALPSSQPGDRPSAPPPPAPRSDFLKRAATAGALVPTLVGLIYTGGAAFLALTLAICVLSAAEFSAMMKAGKKPVRGSIAVLGAAALGAAVALSWPVAPVVAGLAGVVAVSELFSSDRTIERAAFTLLGAALFGLLPGHLVLLRGLSPLGAVATLAFFASAWAMDTLAYAVGRRFGRRLIAPTISPQKTWEGTLAGAVAAVAAPLALAWAFPAWLATAAALKLGLVMATLGQAGGYVNSMIKRENGVKDSGRLLPGHGGVIDRFDSFLLAAAAAFYWLR